MDIYITNRSTKERLRIPMLPEEITGSVGNSCATYNLLKSGEVRIPSGTQLNTYSWTATFPGKKRKDSPYVKGWVKPSKCDVFMKALKARGGTPVKAKLLITETNVNTDVYLQSYEPVYSGGYGDIRYTVTFVQAKSLVVNKKQTGTAKEKNSDKTEGRTPKDQLKTYQVKANDTVWKVARKTVEDGMKYLDIQTANPSIIGSKINNLVAGQILKIPD